MKKLNYTGESKLISRIVQLLNGKAPLPVSNNSTDWGTNGQVLATDGSGSTSWKTVLDNTVDNLVNYYLKTETYTQAEVNALIGSIISINFEIVTVLPTTDISQSTIYLVPKTTAQTDNIYDEYINTTGTSAGWEHIGDTQVDLSNYYTKTESDNLLNNKVDKVSGKQLTTEDFTTALKGKLEGIASGAEVNVQSDWTQSDNTKDDYIKNKPTLATVATSGSYNDLSNKPTIPAADDSWATKNTTFFTATEQNRVDLNTYRTPGNYSCSWSSRSYIDNAPPTGVDGFNLIVVRLQNNDNLIRQFAFMHKGGSLFIRDYDYGTWSSWTTLSSQVNADWNASSGVAQILNKPSLATVATSGSYNDLSDKPTIPTNTDENVKQENTAGNYDFRVLFSNTANDTTNTGKTRKNANLKYNPSTGNLQATQLNGVAIGNSPKFTDTDTKVTDVSNHYTPATDSSADITKYGDGTAGDVVWGTSALLTGLTVKRDAKGHVTDIELISREMMVKPSNVYVGTCDTTASDPNKKVVISNSDEFLTSYFTTLPVGTFLAVKFTNTNSASNCTLSIVDTPTNPTKYTTPASIYYSASVYTGSSNLVCGYANRYVFYIWNGTYWVWNNRGVESSFSSMSKNELVTGTATDQRVVRADYLNEGIRDLIRSYGWGTQGAQTISGTSAQHYDLNTLVTPGNYTCTGTAISEYIDNKPTGSTKKAFNLIVIKNLNSDTYIRQVAWTYDAVNFYIRYSKDSGSTWSSWVNLYQTVGTAALTLKQNGTTLDSFGANATSAKTIDITTPLAGTLYGTCTTGASTAVKVITLDSSYTGTASLPVGTIINVAFENSNTNSSPSIKVGSTTYTVKVLSNTVPNGSNNSLNKSTASAAYTAYESGGVAGYVCQYVISSNNTAVYIGRAYMPQAEEWFYSLAQPVGSLTTHYEMIPYAGTLYKSMIGYMKSNVNTDSVFNIGYNMRLPELLSGSYAIVVYNAQVWATDTSNISGSSAYKLEIDNIWYHPVANTEFQGIWFYFKPLNKGTKNLVFTGEIEFTLTPTT